MEVRVNNTICAPKNVSCLSLGFGFDSFFAPVNLYDDLPWTVITINNLHSAVNFNWRDSLSSVKKSITARCLIRTDECSPRCRLPFHAQQATQPHITGPCRSVRWKNRCYIIWPTLWRTSYKAGGITFQSPLVYTGIAFHRNYIHQLLSDFHCIRVMLSYVITELMPTNVLPCRITIWWFKLSGIY